MQQVAREKALAKFREGNLRVLVATDVAARGIDVADVTHVINYSCPEDEKTYVHRIGRTGRAGASGVAVTFVDWADVTRWKTINKALDLPFDDPAETYSTSEHFFHDMGIAPGTKGRLVPEKPQEPRPRDRPAGPLSRRTRPPSAARARTGRAGTGGRNRTRSGKPRRHGAVTSTPGRRRDRRAGRHRAGRGRWPQRTRRRRRTASSSGPAATTD